MNDGDLFTLVEEVVTKRGNGATLGTKVKGVKLMMQWFYLVRFVRMIVL